MGKKRKTTPAPAGVIDWAYFMHRAITVPCQAGVSKGWSSIRTDKVTLPWSQGLSVIKALTVE